MTKPELSYNLIQVCRDVGDHMEVFHCITNEYNETIREYAEDESENAYKTWWMYLTEEEQELWKDYGTAGRRTEKTRRPHRRTAGGD